ncbi:Asr1405/Asl0597 family protein [Oscillatoria sp. FACHB-1406]|uniref:Asr1405/Asl0597 family protein n=1 Tax=Oscillatoria sp. FACHB-1406 TaxID=2692846 RepID=UPI001683CDB1|nr:Asr1405/Asl0597 family protein [Oscillatoria sp. FACHB-1406]MBD2576910.1 hypothetical protein [Oscillatoria sp. FACHB-1406]
MNSLHSELHSPQIVELRGRERWQIYRRLQELDIPCRCAASKPLRIEVRNSYIAIQLWCVIRNLTASDRELRTRLERCWEQS